MKSEIQNNGKTKPWLRRIWGFARSQYSPAEKRRRMDRSKRKSSLLAQRKFIHKTFKRHGYIPSDEDIKEFTYKRDIRILYVQLGATIVAGIFSISKLVKAFIDWPF